MILPTGKIAFIHMLSQCAKGDLEATIAEIRRLGCTVVAPKVANGYKAWEGLAPFVTACHAEGWLVVGWHYLYCGIYITQSGQWVTTAISPEMEAKVSADQVEALELDGFIIDAEREFKVGNQATRARRYIQALKPRVTVPIGLSSYRFPSLHREFPWMEFLNGCDYHVPQIYWNPPNPAKGFGPEAELERSCKELRAIVDLPIVPIGRAYIGDGHPDPKPNEIAAFLGKAKEMNLPGAGFWALDFLYLHSGGKARSDAIAAFGWDGTKPPEPPTERWEYAITAWARRQPDPYTGPEPDRL